MDSPDSPQIPKNDPTLGPSSPGPSSTRHGDPIDLPSDPDLKFIYVIGDLIRDKANVLKLGDRDALVEFASWVVKAVEGGGIAELPRPSPEQGGDRSVLALCKTCLQCRTDLNNCTASLAQCKATYDACVKCPCI